MLVLRKNCATSSRPFLRNFSSDNLSNFLINAKVCFRSNVNFERRLCISFLFLTEEAEWILLKFALIHFSLLYSVSKGLLLSRQTFYEGPANVSFAAFVAFVFTFWTYCHYSFATSVFVWIKVSVLNITKLSFTSLLNYFKTSKLRLGWFYISITKPKSQ